MSDAPHSPAAPESPAAAEPVSPEELARALQAALAKVSENWDRYLRATAEQDNIRKRAEREVDQARRFALERFARDLVGVADSLGLGLGACGDLPAAQKEGFVLTDKLLHDTLARHGVTPLEPQGAIFDPALHEAMSAVPTAEVAPNTILQVVQRGWLLHDRLLRPAMVVVAKAPPVPEPADGAPPAA